MKRLASPIRTALVAGAWLVVASAAVAQEGGGLLPGASSEQKPGGGLTTCSARNALATKQCTTTCPKGQNADCEDADGGAEPTCSCSGG